MKYTLIISLLCVYCAQSYASTCDDYSELAAEKCESIKKSVQIATGGKGSEYLEIVADIARRENDVKVVPLVTKGSQQNIEYLLWLKGVDLALVQADILKAILDNPGEYGLPENIADKIYLVANVFSEKIYLISSKEEQDIKSVAIIGANNSGSYHTYEFFKKYFNNINIDSTNIVEVLDLDTRTEAYSKLQHKEIDAVFFLANKSVAAIRQEIKSYLATDDYKFIELSPNYPLYPVDPQNDSDVQVRTVDALLVTVYFEDQGRRRSICGFNSHIESLREELGFNDGESNNMLRLNGIEGR